MSNLLFQTIDQISREKGIDPQIVVHAIEDAIVVASRKYFKSNEELRGRLNPETGEIDVFAVKKVVDGVVKRFESGDIIVDLGKTEGKLGKRDQSRLENFSVGDRIRVIITKVDKTAKGPQVSVSRTAPELVQHLFQTEVPEIYDGTVQIKSIAREAGERTKIAVASRERDVD